MEQKYRSEKVLGAFVILEEPSESLKAIKEQNVGASSYHKKALTKTATGGIWQSGRSLEETDSKM
jgi:hypothetical protein